MYDSTLGVRVIKKKRRGEEVLVGPDLRSLPGASGLRVQGAGVRVQGSGFRVQGSLRLEPYSQVPGPEIPGETNARRNARFPDTDWLTAD